jgi:hypothetical protein
MLSQTTKTHSTPLGVVLINDIKDLVAGAGFEPATFRVYDPVYKSVTYKSPPWLGRY